MVQPVFLGKLILYFERYDPDNMAALYEAYGYAAGISLSTLGLARYSTTSTFTTSKELEWKSALQCVTWSTGRLDFLKKK